MMQGGFIFRVIVGDVIWGVVNRHPNIVVVFFGRGHGGIIGLSLRRGVTRAFDSHEA